MSLHFVSDIHLHAGAPHIAERFTQYLASAARQASALYLLGDLFDAWIGDDNLSETFNAEICAAIRAVSTSGVSVYVMRGNRDFLLGTAFAQAAGAQLLADETCISTSGGQSTLLLHGDTLCTDDLAYQAFRRKVHSADWQRDFLAQPLDWRRAEAARLRTLSMQETAHKNATLTDVNSAATLDICRRYQATILIHGHTHRPAVHQHEGFTRYVLSDWAPDRGAALILPA